MYSLIYFVNIVFTQKNIIKQTKFTEIIQDLYNHNLASKLFTTISLCIFNEQFLNDNIEEYINIIKQIFKERKIKIVIKSNKNNEKFNVELLKCDLSKESCPLIFYKNAKYFNDPKTKRIVFCDMAQKHIQIWDNGDVSVCAYTKQYILGNIYTDSLSNIWGKSNEVHSKLLKKEFSGECKYCQYNNRNLKEQIQLLYTKFVPEYLSFLLNYIDLKYISLNKIQKYTSEESTWQGGLLTNPYLYEIKDNKKEFGEDLIKRGTFFPFIATPNLMVEEGKHRLIALFSLNQEYSVPLLIIPFEWSKWNNQNVDYSQYSLTQDITFNFPLFINWKKFRFKEKLLNPISCDKFTTFTTNNLYEIFSAYQFITSSLSQEFFNYPDIKPIFPIKEGEENKKILSKI